MIRLENQFLQDVVVPVGGTGVRAGVLAEVAVKRRGGRSGRHQEGEKGGTWIRKKEKGQERHLSNESEWSKKSK